MLKFSGNQGADSMRVFTSLNTHSFKNTRSGWMGNSHYSTSYRHQTWPHYQKQHGREILSWHVMNAACRGKAFVVSLRDCLIMRSCFWTSCQRPLRKTGCSWGSCAIPFQETCQTTMMFVGERRGGLLRQMRESERQAEKSNDMLWQSWEVTGMMEYIYIAETLCPRKERKTERERDEERRDRNKRSSVSSSAIKEIQFVTLKSELNAMK